MSHSCLKLLKHVERGEFYFFYKTQVESMFTDCYSTNKDDHQNLRHRTLMFFESKFFDEVEFNRLEQLVKKSIYDTPAPRELLCARK